MIHYKLKLPILVICLFFSLFSFAESHNIFIDGGYNPGKDSDMDKLIDGRLDKAEEQVKRIDPNAKRERVDSKAALLAALGKIKCKCGDEINLFFMGHGGDKRFIFSKSKKRKDRKLTADELKEALGAAAIECCCKINIVMFACHSGSFIEPLMEEEHVRSVYASCEDDELSYTSAFYDKNKKFQDDGDWMKGFNEDMKDVAKGSSMADAIAESTESAKEKMPMHFWEKQTPQGWVRDTLDMLGHAEGKIKKQRGKSYVDVILYHPEHLRGQKKRIWLGDNKFPEGIKDCVWIKGPVDFEGPNDPIVFAGDVSGGEKPTEQILGHVKKRWKNGVEVHTLRPRWLFCDKQKVRPIKGKGIARNVQPCKWIDQSIRIHDPFKIDSTDHDIVATTASFKVQYHVTSANYTKGEIKGTILSPRWLRYGKVNIAPGEKEKLKKLKGCTNLWMDITIPTDGLPVASDVRTVHRDDIKTWSDDVAINPVEDPIILPMSKTAIPIIGATNIGTNPANFEIKVTITEVSDDEGLKDYVTSLPGNQKDYSTGCECKNCEVIYNHSIVVSDLDPSHDTSQRFPPMITTPGKTYRLCASIVGLDDVPNNNYTTTIFTVPEQMKPEIPSGFEFDAVGTNNTTGNVIELTVTNNGDEIASVEVGNWIVPSTNKYQGYIIADTYLISLNPGETQTIPLHGYCIKVNLPPVPAGEAVTDFENWITPDMTGSIFTPDSPPPEGSPWTPVTTADFGEFVPTYPGTDSMFLYKIDTDKYPIETAPSVYFNYEVTTQIIDDNIATASFPPNISNNPGKLTDDLTQQISWFGSGALEEDVTEQYDFEDFEETFIKNTEEELNIDLDNADDNVKAAVDSLVADLYDAISLVGTEAKVLKANPETH